MSDIVQNWVKFSMFLSQKFFGGQAGKFLEQQYITKLASDHSAKFRSNRPRDLGDLALKIRKINKNCCKTKSLPDCHSRQPSNSR